MKNDQQIKPKTTPKPTGNGKPNRNKTVQQTKPTVEATQEIQQAIQEAIAEKHEKAIAKKGEVNISPFVTNLDGNVYAITNLPEEFIATLFAWVSRSSKSFKTHLKDAVTDFNIQAPPGDGYGQLDQKAKDFHEKWTVGYGHSSVAEHATAHVGIESISRLASAELELANSFLSITEYSQRYQKPVRGGWHNPIVDTLSKGLMVQESIECFYNKSFDAFEKLIEGIYTHLKKEWVHSPEYQDVKDDSKKVDRHLNALMKLAFEDARYVLPLGMHTQLGMTANGRAWRDSLAILGNSEHAESKKLSDDIRTEVTKVLPVLLKYATPSQYQRNSKAKMIKLLRSDAGKVKPTVNVQLHMVESEKVAINKLIALLIQQYSDLPFSNGLYRVTNFSSLEEKEMIIKELLFEMVHFDTAPDVFKHIRYDASLLVSEANWHQLLRHNRMTDFTFTNPTVDFGITIPPRIVEAGLQHLLKDIAEESEELYTILVQEGYAKEAEYVVTNAHKRQVYASFSLWEAYHLINLRTSEEAQWDIRETFEELFKQLKAVHPLLISQAKRRLS